MPPKVRTAVPPVAMATQPDSPPDEPPETQRAAKPAEPPKKMRKVTLGSLLGGKIKKEPVRRRRRRSTSWRSRNSYLADTDVPDILNW